MNDHSRAKVFCQKALSEAHDNWSLALTCYNQLGRAYEQEPELALWSCEKALELQLRYNPADHHTLASIYNNIDLVHLRLQSDKQVTTNYYEKALEICISIPDENEIKWDLYATILNNLATFQLYDDIDLVLEKEHLALDIRLKYLPLSHPVVGTTHRILATFYSLKAEYDKAFIHFNEALHIKLKYSPNNDSSIYQLYHDISLSTLYKGDYEINAGHEAAAKVSYETALKFSSDAIDHLSSNELSTSTKYSLLCYCVNICGVLYTRLNRFNDAIECFNKLINILNQHLPTNDPLHIAFFRNRGRVFTLQGNLNTGMEYYENAIKFCK
ncbi:hypothetical protein I4U23_031523 [Adineta vaga]|nr:hypothetical protein I4U23_031523 [Adineta vaga]